MMIKSGRSQKGLTIIETILVASIISIIALSLYNAIANGLKVWDRAHKFMAEEDIALFLESISRDLHNTVFLSNMMFVGDPEALSFPAVIRVREDPYTDPMQKRYVDQIGRVRYAFDNISKSLYRQEANYSLAIRNKYFGPRTIVRSLRGVKFVYYTVKEEELIEMNDTRSWPVMVKIIVRYQGPRGQESVIEKSVVLPMHSIGNV